MPAQIFNHLWQSTMFAAAAGLLAIALRKNRAHVRHSIWLIASIKFLIPLSLLIGIGSRVPLPGSPAPVRIVAAVEPMREQLAGALFTAASSAAPSSPMPWLAGIWACGLIGVLAFWWVRWRGVRAIARNATALDLGLPVSVASSASLVEPGVFGVFKPLLLLPQGIAERLTPAQLRAVLAHELCHVRRRDNLAAAIHMFVEAIFWFHPLVWWIGARLVAERERACDEDVLQVGNRPEVYAEGILKICEFYVAAPVPCVSGVTGASLKQRIEDIMTKGIAQKLGWARALLLAAAALAAITGPVWIGMGRAQSKPRLEFEVASVKPNKSGAQRITVQRGQGYLGTNVSLQMLIMFAYEIRPNQLANAPAWLTSERFDVVARAPNATPEQRREMMQSLLADRFKLVVRRETKEMAIYALVLAKGGSKLQPSKEAETQCDGGRGQILCRKIPVSMLARELQGSLGRSVIDETGLTAEYDIKLDWTPDQPAAAPQPGEPAAAPPEQTGPSIFTAIQEQLGLKLESRKGQVDQIVIDRIEKVPTEN